MSSFALTEGCRVVRALSADADWLQAQPAQRSAGRVHSVFKHVINLEVGHERLLTLAHCQSDDAPDTVVTELAQWSELALQAGDTVHFSAAQITLPGLAIALDQVRTWSCRLPPYAADDRPLRANLVLAREYLEQQGSGIGLQRAAAAAASGFEQALVQAFGQASQGLCQAVQQNDMTLAQQHIVQLLGLGPGLTPAGDDFLVGLLAVLAIPGGPCRAGPCLGELVMARAFQQTNAISAAALRHAAQGRVRDRLIQLCESLMYSDSSTMRRALDRVLAIGSSSGSDIAAGMLSAFQLHLQIN